MAERRPQRYFGSYDDFPSIRINGTWYCVWCWRPCEGRKRRYCSKECWDQAAILFGIGMLSVVYDRDGGVCAECGLNTDFLETRIREIISRRGWKWATRLARRIGLTHCEMGSQLWQADHVRPVAIYGPAMSVDELRTLCIWCHKRRTREEHARLARVRRIERESRLPLLAAMEA